MSILSGLHYVGVLGLGVTSVRETRDLGGLSHVWIHTYIIYVPTSPAGQPIAIHMVSA